MASENSAKRAAARRAAPAIGLLALILAVLFMASPAQAIAVCWIN